MCFRYRSPIDKLQSLQFCLRVEHFLIYIFYGRKISNQLLAVASNSNITRDTTTLSILTLSTPTHKHKHYRINSSSYIDVHICTYWYIPCPTAYIHL